LHPFAPFPRNRSEKRSRHFRRLYLSFGQEAESLLQLGRNARELAVERGADRIDRRNDDDRNASGNQALFNRSRTRLVLEKRKQLGNLTQSIQLQHFMHRDNNLELLRKTLSNFRTSVAGIAKMHAAKFRRLLSINSRRDEKGVSRSRFGNARRRRFATLRVPPANPR